MKQLAVLSVAVALLAVSAGAQSPDPTNDHEWLKQLVGEWDVQFKITNQPAVAGTDSVRALGKHWIVAEMKTAMMGAPFRGQLSLGRPRLCRGAGAPA